MVLGCCTVEVAYGIRKTCYVLCSSLKLLTCQASVIAFSSNWHMTVKVPTFWHAMICDAIHFMTLYHLVLKSANEGSKFGYDLKHGRKLSTYSNSS